MGMDAVDTFIKGKDKDKVSSPRKSHKGKDKVNAGPKGKKK